MIETKQPPNFICQGKRLFVFALAFILPILLLHNLRQAEAATSTPLSAGVSTPTTAVFPFAYGANVAEWDITKLDDMGFNWIKVFNGPGSRLPLKVLLRVDANASHMGNVNSFGNSVQSLAELQKGFVDAYEIGNEPNLDATYGWGYGSSNVPPDAADYATLLCEAYGRIKTADPDALVVSAGLAPTGRVVETWNGHAGHNGLFQDERIFMQEMLDAMQMINGAPCFDVFGYHPYGYSADFDALPDVGSADPTQDCANGFCFRGVEKIYGILQANGLGDKQIFATEFGWIVEPPADCLSNDSWAGRAWQIVSEQKQADNLVGAYEYATANYPWLGGMFLFNLNFNVAPWITDQCEQMRYYAIANRPAEAALAAMPKVEGAGVGELSVMPEAVTAVYTPTQQPIDETISVTLKNVGTAPLAYTMTLQTTLPLTLTVNAPLTGSLDVGMETAVPLQFGLDGQPIGSYSGTVQIETSSNGIVDGQSVLVTVRLWDEIYRTFLPLAVRP
ncbi:hypothetical protein [Candidatus Leptofilum sp.]|uniref:hypothetical protein n=1 Tax=Candidatus Leptofilum sp. TaxID=3241576 RepID=UPI003B5B6328